MEESNHFNKEIMKKKKIEKKIAKSLFTLKERTLIIQALDYSAYRYKRHGEVRLANEVQAVLDRTTKLFGAEENYTKSQVDAIVEKTIKEVSCHYNEILANEVKKAEKRGFIAGSKNNERFKVFFDPAKKDGEYVPVSGWSTFSVLERCKDEKKKDEENKKNAEREIPIEDPGSSRIPENNDGNKENV